MSVMTEIWQLREDKKRLEAEVTRLRAALQRISAGDYDPACGQPRTCQLLAHAALQGSGGMR
jgi:hypothetical protein